MGIFKLEWERPAYNLHGNLLFYLKQRTLLQLDLITSKDTGFVQLRNNPRIQIHSISYNPAEQSVLVVTRAANLDNSIYELYPVPVDADCPQEGIEGIEGMRSNSVTAIWIARNPSTVLDRSHTVSERYHLC